MTKNQFVYPDQETFIFRYCVFSFSVLPVLQLVYLVTYAFDPDIFSAFPTSLLIEKLSKFEFDYSEINKKEGEIAAMYFNTYNLILTITSTIVSIILSIVSFIITIFLGIPIKTINWKSFGFVIFGFFAVVWFVYFEPTPYRYTDDGGRYGISLSYSGMFFLAVALSILNLLMIVIFVGAAKMLISIPKLLRM